MNLRRLICNRLNRMLKFHVRFSGKIFHAITNWFSLFRLPALKQSLYDRNNDTMRLVVSLDR